MGPYPIRIFSTFIARGIHIEIYAPNIEPQHAGECEGNGHASAAAATIWTEISHWAFVQKKHA